MPTLCLPYTIVIIKSYGENQLKWLILPRFLPDTDPMPTRCLPDAIVTIKSYQENELKELILPRVLPNTLPMPTRCQPMIRLISVLGTNANRMSQAQLFFLCFSLRGSPHFCIYDLVQKTKEKQKKRRERVNLFLHRGLKDFQTCLLINCLSSNLFSFNSHKLNKL